MLTVNYSPLIDLSDGVYELGLTDFKVFYTIPNVDSSKKRLQFLRAPTR